MYIVETLTELFKFTASSVEDALEQFNARFPEEEFRPIVSTVVQV